MRLSTLTAVILALGLAACGGSNDKENQDADVAARAEKFSQLPATAILAVPVVNGVEATDQAELRTSNAQIDLNNAAELASAFQSGAKATVSNELDADSSTQSWRCWRSCYNYGWRYNTYSYYYYQPVVYYGGYNWSYYRGGYGYYNSYNYYGYYSYNSYYGNYWY